MRLTGTPQLPWGDAVSAAIHQDLSQGLWTLRLTAASVPLLGFLETCSGIFYSFKGCAGEKSYCMAAMVYALAEGICPCAFGLAIGVVIVWMHAYLRAEIDTLELEMKCAALQLFNQLSLAPFKPNTEN